MPNLIIDNKHVTALDDKYVIEGNREFWFNVLDRAMAIVSQRVAEVRFFDSFDGSGRHSIHVNEYSVTRETENNKYTKKSLYEAARQHAQNFVFTEGVDFALSAFYLEVNGVPTYRFSAEAPAMENSKP